MNKHAFAGVALCAMSHSAPAVETEVLLYNAFSPAPAQVSLEVKESLQGECLTHSRLSSREDAWRCMAGNRLLDPCYVRTYVKRNELVCPTAPWKSEGIALTIGRELPEPQVQIDAYHQDPWAIQLMSGKTCLQVNEAGKKQYQCDGIGTVDGTLHRCKGLWSFILQSKTDVFTTTEQVAKAFY